MSESKHPTEVADWELDSPNLTADGYFDYLLKVDEAAVCWVGCEQPLPLFEPGQSLIFKLYSLDQQCVSQAVIYYNHHGTIELLGFNSIMENKGYGSQLLESLLALGQQLQLPTLTGHIYATDHHHFNKLQHFYGKLGFQFEQPANRQYTGIISRQFEDL